MTTYCERPAGQGLRAPPTGDQQATPPKPRRIWEAGAAGPPATGRRPATDGGRSQHYCGSLDCRLPLVAFWQTKSERKMLASTCFYSLYAWFNLLVNAANFDQVSLFSFTVK